MIIHDQHERIGKWVFDATGGYMDAAAVAIGNEHDGRLTAGVVFEKWNGRIIWAHFRIEPHGATREWIWFGFHYAFNQLGAHKIVGPVSSANERAIRLDRHFGFECEAVIRGGCADGDLLMMTMTRDKCRFIGR